MQDWMLSFVNDYGYLGILFLIFIENVFPPIPSEAVLLFGGALTIKTSMNIPATILVATAGSVAGAIVLYALGRVFQAERLKKLLEGKFGRITHLRPDHVEKAQQWFIRYEGKAVLICRCIPIVRSLISIPAGFAKMNFAKFLLLTALGSAVWNSLLILIGAGLGNAWEKAMPYLEKYTHIFIIIFIIAIIAFFAYYFIRRHRRIVKINNEKNNNQS